MGAEDESTCLSDDIESVRTAVLEDGLPDGDKMGLRLQSPSTIRAFGKEATSQIKFTGLNYGSRNRPERTKSLRFLLGIHKETPD